MTDTRKWYQKKRWILSAIAGAIFISSLGGDTTSTANYATPQAAPTVQSTSVANTPTAPVVKDVPSNSSVKTQAPTLSNSNYYTNVDGNSVHSPAYSSGGVPAGASAKCRDGTYSFSQNRRGTCSRHGGVSVWY